MDGVITVLCCASRSPFLIWIVLSSSALSMSRLNHGHWAGIHRQAGNVVFLGLHRIGGFDIHHPSGYRIGRIIKIIRPDNDFIKDNRR